MAEEDGFEIAVAEAQIIESKALPHVPYSGSLEIKRVIDFAPEDYANASFDDLLNQYERVGKIIKTSRLNIYSTGVSPKLSIQTKAKGGEVEVKQVEVKLKEISEASLHKVEEMKNELEKEPQLKAPEQVTTSFEFEREWETVQKPEFEPEPESKLESESKPETSFVQEEHEKLEEEFTSEKEEAKEKEKELPDFSHEEITDVAKEAGVKTATGRKELKPLERALARVRERKGLAPGRLGAPSPSIPPALEAAVQSPSESTVFETIQQTFNAEWGTERDEPKIRRKMLELTKELFREKSTSRREGIKQQIVVLKNMLITPAIAVPENTAERKMEKKMEKPKTLMERIRAAEGVSYSTSLFATLSNTLSSEFSSKIDSFGSDSEKQISVARENFQSALSGISEDDSGSRKTAFDKFVFEMTKVNEQLVTESEKFRADISSRHAKAMDHYIASLDPKDEAAKKKAMQKKKEIIEGYEISISSLKTNIGNKISSLIDVSSRNILAVESTGDATQKPREEKKKKEELDVAGTILEINGLDEGSLLYYLHSRDSATYKKFERGHLSKQEAVVVARRKMAKEKDLSDSVINKNWGVE